MGIEVIDTNIWVSFEQKDIVPVLGMNVLRKTIFLYDKNGLSFYRDEEELRNLLK